MENAGSIESKIDHDIPNMELSPQKQIEILKETQLSLRRLVGWNPIDDSVLFRYGIVSHVLSKIYLREAFSSGNEFENSSTHNRTVVTTVPVTRWVGLAKTEQEHAKGAMERVQKLNNSFAPKASLWWVKLKLKENFVMSYDELLAIENAVRLLIDSESVTSSAKLTLGQILVERSLRVSSGLDSKKSLELLTEAEQLLRTVSTSGVISLSLLAEANAIAAPAKGQEYANKALQGFWSTRETESQSPDSLAAVFRCLLLINSVKEAQIFLSEHLQQISAVDQSRFRALTAATALRHLVSVAIFEDKHLRTIRESSSSDASIASGGVDRAAVSPAANALPLTLTGRGEAAELGVVLSMAVQLNPESLELLSLMERFARASDKDELLVSLKSAMGFAGNENAGAADSTRSVKTELDVSARSFLLAVAGLGAGDLDKTAVDNLVAALKASPAYGVVASRLAMRLNAAGSMTSELATRWLQTINDASPEILVAWSDRASLHLKDKQFPEAIECYEFLLEKLPGNEQVAEALEGAKKLSKAAGN